MATASAKVSSVLRHAKWQGEGRALLSPGKVRLGALLRDRSLPRVRIQQADLQKCYSLFCRQLFSSLQSDLGRNPQHGWNFSNRFEPVYLFLETRPKYARKKAMSELRDSAGRSCHGDGRGRYHLRCNKGMEVAALKEVALAVVANRK
ncbi:hypothetical protein AK812_SmicGene47078, partial [Symbiodinium microadriaticum]